MSYIWKISFVSINFCLLISLTAYAQNDSTFQQINQQVWQPFCKAYQQLDHQILKDVHSKDLIRVSGNGQKISTYQTAMDTYQKSFERSIKKTEERTISLRFFERIYNESKASERGIYELIVNEGLDTEKRHYGKFHVILQKEKEVWKILMDYDSNENIGEKDFKAAYAMDNFEEFEKKN